MREVFLLLFTVLCIISDINAQYTNIKVVLITLVGLRLQELFSGTDSLLKANKTYVSYTTALKETFWRKTVTERRQELFPFLWKEVSKIGQLHGNRILDSKMDLTNALWLSYPGYSEILTSRADDTGITRNDKFPNPNATMLELANKDPRYKGKVAVFGSWDVFPYIINATRSGIPVNAGFDLAKGENLMERETFLNQLRPKVPSPWETARLGAFTHYYAVEHMKNKHPEFIYIAYRETDDFAQDGDYAAYIKSA